MSLVRSVGVSRGIRKALLETPENPVKRDVLSFLRAHPLVAWAQRMNTGAARLKGFYVKFGFVGCSDILGQLKDGRFLAVETKAPKGKSATKMQEDFIAKVRSNNGVAGICRSIEDAQSLLETA
jgi:hypothetical protein